MSTQLPETSCRLFSHYEDPAALPATSPQLVVARLLEEGNRSDLQWLTGAYSESQLSFWLDKYGSRLLSIRSRSFWRTVLDQLEPSTREPGNPLWPL